MQIPINRRKLVQGGLACVLPAGLLLGRTSRLFAQSRWPYENVAGKFQCHSTFDLKPYESLFAELAELETDLAATLGVVKVREPIHLYLFSTKGVYQQYVKQYFPDVPFRRALFVKNRGPGMVFAFMNDDFAIDLRHESTHAVLHASLPLVPLWLDEGLAEYFEVPRVERGVANPHMRTIRWATRLGRAPDLEKLEAKANLTAMDRGDYRDSWAWTHFMLHGPKEAHDELVAFLSDIQASTPPGFLSERLRRRIPDLEKRYIQHFRNWS